jgi:hypothetical protein
MGAGSPADPFPGGVQHRHTQLFKSSGREAASSLTYARFITIFPASAKRFSGGYPAPLGPGVVVVEIYPDPADCSF